MKKIIILVILVTSTMTIRAQVSQMIKSKISTELSRIRGDHYEGNVSLKDYKEISDKTYIVIGTFDWRYYSYITASRVIKRKFKAKVKVVFDEIEVIALGYEYCSNLEGGLTGNCGSEGWREYLAGEYSDFNDRNPFELE